MLFAAFCTFLRKTMCGCSAPSVHLQASYRSCSYNLIDFLVFLLSLHGQRQQKVCVGLLELCMDNGIRGDRAQLSSIKIEFRLSHESKTKPAILNKLKHGRSWNTFLSLFLSRGATMTWITFYFGEHRARNTCIINPLVMFHIEMHAAKCHRESQLRRKPCKMHQ